MVYGYKTNEEFIDKSYQLLEKLKAKGLWNKDTLVIGLDKSVRPLAYTLRKLSDLEGKEKPDMRFFNYSAREYRKEIPGFLLDEKIDYEKLDVDKQVRKLLSSPNYNKILILDEFPFTGNSLIETERILKNNLIGLNKNSEIFFASLSSLEPHLENKYLRSRDIISADNAFILSSSPSIDTGITDEKGSYPIKSKSLLNNEDIKKELKEKGFSKRKIKNEMKKYHEKSKKEYSKFLINRYQLSRDIKNYLHEKHPEKVSGKSKSKTLERIVSGIFVSSFLIGLFLSSGNLTGNVIGTSFSEGHKLLGIILILIGIGGFFVFRELSKD